MGALYALPETCRARLRPLKPGRMPPVFRGHSAVFLKGTAMEKIIKPARLAVIILIVAITIVITSTAVIIVITVAVITYSGFWPVLVIIA